MQQPLINLPDPEWIQLLRAEAGKGRSITEIARECGMKRPSVSMLISGTYPARSFDLVTRKHAAKVMALYRSQVLCPHLQVGLSAEACRSFAGAPMSTHSPDKLRHYIACRRCPLNPLKPEGQK